MAARRAKQRKKLLAGVGLWLRGADPAMGRRRARRGLGALLGVAMLAACGYGLWWLEGRVLQSPVLQSPPKLRLVDVPDHLRAVVTASLDPFAGAAWSSTDLCANIAAELGRNPWVASVERVQRYADHRIDIHCTYRHPRALVQFADAFYLVDEEGVCLPGRYANSPDFLIVQGVATAPPPPGEEWEAPDLLAGLAIVKLLDRELFARQLIAVLVHNFHGRRDAREPHIELATNRTGGRIAWGSEIGEEIEENSPEQKLALLRANYGRFGHVDAGRPRIDVSVHPDRITTPADAEDGSVVGRSEAWQPPW